MKTIVGVLTGLLLLSVGGAFAQTSDYEIIESFKRKSQSLFVSINEAQDSGRCAVLEQEVGRLQSEYAPHGALLAEGLHPENLQTSIARLRNQLQQAVKRVTLAEESRQDKAKIDEISRRVEADTKTIEEITRQNSEYRAALERLTQEVNELSARIQNLAEENSGLLGQVKALQLEGKKDKESIAKLKQLTDKLTANLRDRDALVIKMMDSIFGEFAKADLTDAQKQELFVNVKGSDYVGPIVAAVEGNVKYAETALFTAEDANQITKEQQTLSAKWDELKPFVAKLYPDEQTKIRDIATVDTLVSSWKKSIEETTWKSMHQVFAGQNADIGAFSNASEFHARLLAYIDGQIRDPSRERYQRFKRTVWDSPIKDKWLPLIPTDELTESQRSEIDARIAQWDKAVSDLVRRWILIGVVVAALLAGLAVALRRKKKPALPA